MFWGNTLVFGTYTLAFWENTVELWAIPVIFWVKYRGICGKYSALRGKIHWYFGANKVVF